MVSTLQDRKESPLCNIGEKIIHSGDGDFIQFKKGEFMRRIALLSLIALSAVVESGCSLMAPQYSASMDNVQKLKDAGNYNAKVGSFTSQKDPENANPISLRGSSLSSPYESSYAAYLQEAIKQELSLAGKLAAGADLEVTGVLLKNDLDASGFSTGYGKMEAKFVIKKGSQVLYDKTKSAQTQWESSFAGAIAIPRAQQEYPRLVQKLLAELYADESFLRALK